LERYKETNPTAQYNGDGSIELQFLRASCGDRNAIKKQEKIIKNVSKRKVHSLKRTIEEYLEPEEKIKNGKVK